MFWLAAGIVRGATSAARWSRCATTRRARARPWASTWPRYKTRAFALSAAYAGVGGALFAFAIGFVAPESFTLALSFSFLAAIVVGGLATVAGALFGALFIVFVPVWSSDVNEALSGVIYGGGADRRHVRAAAAASVGLLRRVSAQLVQAQGQRREERCDEVD